MSELGQQLKEARLKKGMSLDDVQEMTKIRKRYLEAIEAGDYKVLPGNFYVRAFIKTYAETVGLDPDLLLEDHKQEAPADPEPMMEPVIQKRSSTRSSERNVKWLSPTFMWIFPILIIAVIYLYANGASHPKTDKVEVDSSKVTNNQQDPTKKPAETTSPAKNTDKTTEGNTNTPGQTDTAGGTAGGNQSVTPPDNGTGSTTPDNGTESNTTDNGTTTPPGNQTVTVQQVGKKNKDTIFNVAAPQGTTVMVEIKATGESWLEVYEGENIHGKKLSFGKTKDGDTVSVPLNSSGIYIKSGYSPATTITVGGQTVTDGKMTSRILLKPADPGSMTGDGANSGGTDTSGSTGNNGR